MPDLTRVAKLANRAAIPGPEEFLTRQPWHRYQSGPFAEIDLARHRLLERTTITRDAMGQRALNFGITPAADPFRWMRGDVWNDCLPPGACHFVATLTKPIRKILLAIGTA